MQRVMNNIYNIIIILLAVIILLMGVDGCNNRNEIETAKINLSEKDKLITTYRSNEGWLMESNTVTEALRVEQVEGLEKLLDSMDARKPSVVIKYKSSFRVDTLNFAFVDSIPCAEFIEPFNLDSSFIKFRGVVTNKTLSIYNVEVPNDLIVAIGEHHRPWYKFSKDSVSVLVHNSNTHVKGVQLEAYTFAPKQPFYNRAWFKAAVFGIGLVTGAAIIK